MFTAAALKGCGSICETHGNACYLAGLQLLTITLVMKPEVDCTSAQILVPANDA